jgi:hypothetical protein
MIANNSSPVEFAGQYEELLELATPLERNKIELDDWAISGGIYCDFFMLRNLFQNDGTTNELVSCCYLPLVSVFTYFCVLFFEGN